MPDFLKSKTSRQQNDTDCLYWGSGLFLFRNSIHSSVVVFLIRKTDKYKTNGRKQIQK